MARHKKELTLREKSATGFKQFYDAIHQESDRGFMMVVNSALDNALGEAIQTNLLKINPKSAKQVSDLLFDMPMAPLGSFAVRISMAFCLGLIDGEFFAAINILRSIRNKAGHAEEAFRLAEHEHSLDSIVQSMSSKEQQLIRSVETLCDGQIKMGREPDVAINRRARSKFEFVAISLHGRLAVWTIYGRPAHLSKSQIERGILDTIYDRLQPEFESLKSSLEQPSAAALKTTAFDQSNQERIIPN